MKAVLGFILLMFSLSKASAEVSWRAYPTSGEITACGDAIPQVTGFIQRGDSGQLSKKLFQIKQRLGKSRWEDCLTGGIGKMVIWLDSRGGDIESALEIGRIVRKHKMTVVVHQQAECSSSCVFILGAGVVRNVFGRVGIHRPYFGVVDGNAEYSEIRTKRDSMLRSIEAYLREIDVPQSLIDLMNGVPPEQVRYLSDRELEDLRLSGNDPSFDEKQVATRAWTYGVSSFHYRQKIAEANSKCAVYRDPTYCIHSLILGISIRESEVLDKEIWNCFYRNHSESKGNNSTYQKCHRDLVKQRYGLRVE